MTTRILILGQQKLAVQCLEHVVSSIDGVKRVGLADSMTQVLYEASRIRPHVCFWVGDPLSESMAFVQELVREHQDCACGVVTRRREARAVRAALDAGFKGYLVQDAEVDELQAALMDLRAGRYAFSDRVAVASDVGEVPIPRWDALSEREVEVLRDVANGLSARESGDRLNISSKTIDSHRRRIQSKLALATPAEMTRVGLVEGLVELGPEELAEDLGLGNAVCPIPIQ